MRALAQHTKKRLQQREQFLQEEIKLVELLDTATAQEHILEQLQVGQSKYHSSTRLGDVLSGSLLSPTTAASILAPMCSSSHNLANP
jgi:hypothetical protein